MSRSSPRRSCRCGPATVDFCEPAVDRVQANFEKGVIEPWDRSKVDIDGYEPGLVTGTAGEMATNDGKRYCLPSVWGTEAMVYNTEEAPMEYGTAGLGTCSIRNMSGTVTVRPHSAWPPWAASSKPQGQLPQPFIETYTNMDVMRRIRTSS